MTCNPSKSHSKEDPAAICLISLWSCFLRFMFESCKTMTECCHFVSVTLCRWHVSQIWLCTSHYEPVIFCSSLVESEPTCLCFEKRKFSAKKVLLLHRFWNICSFSLFLRQLLSSLEVSFRWMAGFIRSLNGLYMVCCLPPDVKPTHFDHWLVLESYRTYLATTLTPVSWALHWLVTKSSEVIAHHCQMWSRKQSVSVSSSAE